jgi:hypothetical protein
MVDIDRGPDPLESLAALIANDVTRANRVGSLTDATHDRDTAITANFLVDPDLHRFGRYADAITAGGHETCCDGQICNVIAVADAELAELIDLIRKAAHLMALGWAVEKAASRGEVEVLIADLRASAHATQHRQEKTT